MLILVDIDLTIADARPRLKKAGQMPHRGKKAHFQQWLDRLQSDKSLLADPVVANMRETIYSLAGAGHKLVYLTGRSELYRPATLEWLTQNWFPNAELVMRGKNDWRSAKGYKEAAVRILKKKYGTGISLDDDSEGDCSQMYQKHGFVHLKVFLPKVID